MKLFLYDEKHENINGELELTNIDQAKTIINFLKEKHLTDRYNSLIIASSYTVQYDDNKEKLIIFNY